MSASKQEHDKWYPPRRENESAADFLYRALWEHRASHTDWQKWCTDHPEEKVSDGTDADYQQRAVERYDEMLNALREIAGSPGRDVQPPPGITFGGMFR